MHHASVEYVSGYFVKFCRIVPGLLSQLMTFHKSEKSDAQLMPEGTTGRYWQMKLGKEWKSLASGDAIGDAVMGLA